MAEQKFNTPQPSTFVFKSYELINIESHNKIINWLDNGTEFIINDIESFEQHILPKYFRHKNINSFIRQLNMYGFHKSRKEPSKNIFSHPFFIEGREQLLPLVKKKSKEFKEIEELQEKEDQKVPLLKIRTMSMRQEQQLKPGLKMTDEKAETANPNHKTKMIDEKTTPTSLTAKKNHTPRQQHTQESIKSNSDNPSSTQNSNSQPLTFFQDSDLSQILPIETESTAFKNIFISSHYHMAPMVYEISDYEDILSQNHFDSDNSLSIQGEIQKQRRIFHNRHSGISIVSDVEDFESTDMISSSISNK